MQIPHNYIPRNYQIGLYNCLADGFKRAIVIWHRRAGKDKTMLNMIAKEMMNRVGAYYYFYPTYEQARKALWDAMDENGFKMMGHFPKKIIKSKNDQQMKIETVNGSLFQIMGTDKNIDQKRGLNMRGSVFSEYAFQNPMAYRVMRPILTKNPEAWAIFNTTFNGKNHAWRMYETRKDDKKWFTEKLSIEDTGAITLEAIEQEKIELRDEGWDEEEIDMFIRQEYFCEVTGFVRGAIYLKQIQEAENQNRLCRLPFEKSLDVDCFFDLGRSDDTSILFIQTVGKEIRIIDSHSQNGQDISFYIDFLKSKEYRYGTIYLPHDAEMKRIEHKKSVKAQFEDAGFRVKIVPREDVQVGIRAVKKIFPRLYIDSIRCEDFLDAVRSYHREYDDKKQSYSIHPEHDWSSHYADALRYLALGYEERRVPDNRKKAEIDSRLKAGYMPGSKSRKKRFDNRKKANLSF